jgi:23S rRNA (cytosine1962-C5)-methyltransferase
MTSCSTAGPANIEPGALAVLEDANRVPLGVGVATVEARIGFRMLDRDAGAIDRPATWLAAKLKDALRLREALHDAPFYRLVHAEGDGLPGLIVDRFGDTLVIQPNAVWLDNRLPDDHRAGCRRSRAAER